MGSPPQSLPMPPWMTGHGETELVYYADTGGNDAWRAKCKRHYTESSDSYREYAEKWRCPQCVAEARQHERETRDE